MYFTYIIRCKDDSLYTGYTSNIARRMNEHKLGINSKYTRAKGFKKLEIYFATNTKSNAMKLEYYIKRLTRDKKLSIIKNPNILIDSIDNKENYIIGEEIKELK